MKLSDTEKRINELTLTGYLALDFANTSDWRTSDHPDDFLTSYRDLVAWSRHAGVLSERMAQRILQRAARHTAEARSVFSRAIALREVIFRIFSAVATKDHPAKADIELLNVELRKAYSHLRIKRTPEEFVWEWAEAHESLECMLWAVVRAACELLVDKEALLYLRECPGEGCNWLFVDKSRNRTRRWCDMNVCGNRAKVAAHYERKRLAEG